MQQVCGGVVAPRGVAQVVVHLRGDRIAHPDAALLDLDLMEPRPSRHLRHARHGGREPARFRGEASRVGHLAARLDVERRPGERGIARVAGRQRLDFLARAVEQGDDGRAGHARRRVALELVTGLLERPPHRVRRREELGLVGPVESAPRPRALLLGRQGALVPGVVDRNAALRRGVFDEVLREAVRIVQAERVFALEDAGLGRLIEQLLEAGQPFGQHGLESDFFGLDDLRHVIVAGSQLGVGVAHLADEHVDQPAQEGLRQPEVMGVAHRTPHDLAQHVPAPFIGRQDAVGDEERHGAGVVGNDPGRHVRRLHRALVLAAGELADGLEQRLEQVRVVIRQRALHDRRDPLEAHARVDGRGRQRHEALVGLAVELHEHVVPDLDVAIARTRHAAAHWLRARQVIAAEVVNLGAAAAGTGVAHRPEVVLLAEFRDSGRREHAQPVSVRLVVARHALVTGEHRREQPVGGQLPDVGQEGPGEGDGVVLEVIPEREVAQHLEERVMPERRPDVLEVVVLAADPHALLRTWPRAGSRACPVRGTRP